MQYLKALSMIALLAGQTFALPAVRSNAAAVPRAAAGADADEAIAYAWFNEDEKPKDKRAPSGSDDADEAIAYAWFNEDDKPKLLKRIMIKRIPSGGDDADEAIAYAWFNEDEQPKKE